MRGFGKFQCADFDGLLLGRPAGDWMSGRLPENCWTAARQGNEVSFEFVCGEKSGFCLMRSVLPLFSPSRADALLAAAVEDGYDGVWSPSAALVASDGMDPSDWLVAQAVSTALDCVTVQVGARTWRLRAAAEDCLLSAREDFSRTEAALQREILQGHRARGVTVYGGDSQRIEADVQIGEGSILYPNNCLCGSTQIGEHAVLYPNSFLSDCRIGAGTRIYPGNVLERCRIGENCLLMPNNFLRDTEVGDCTEVTAVVAREAKLGSCCTTGPYAYLRPKSQAADGCRVGDFVELKNAQLGEGTKVSHLTYVGDATLGRGCNVGCGVVFANYDGKRKHHTKVGDECFIGSNCNLVAPVTLEDGCYIAAGTTVTQDVESEDFGIGRVRQQVLPKLKGRYRRIKSGD